MESYVKRIEDITEEQTELLMDSLEMDLESFEKELLSLDKEEPYRPPHQRLWYTLNNITKANILLFIRRMPKTLQHGR